MSYEGKTFPEAVESLAEEYGIEIPRLTGEEAVEVSEAAQKKEKFYQLNQWAREFYIDRLHSEEGREASQYLERRGISSEMIETFGLGYAPDDWGRLTSFLRDKGADLELACEVGLLKMAEGSDRIYDRYRHRVMFPIVEPSGRLCGFGGRILRDSDGAKYLNSPESLIFHKSKILYGLNLARQTVRKQDHMVLVEGYLDVICMHQFGFTQTVAALGTSLNKEHLQTLKRYSKNTILLFDADKAGVKAAGRALQVLLPGGASVSIGALPEGEDPDSFLQKHGRQAMEKMLVEDVSPGLDFWTKHLMEEAGGDPVKLRDVTGRVLELLQAISDPILQNFYLRRASELLEVEEAQLRRGFFRVVKHPAPATQRLPEASIQEVSLDNSINIEHRALAKLIKIVIENPDLFSYVSQAEVVTRLPTPSLSQLWEQLIRDVQEGADASFLSEMVLDELEREPVFKRLLAQTLLRDPPFAGEDVEDEWEAILFTLQRLELERELQALQKEIKIAGQEGAQDRLLSLVRQRQAVQERRLTLIASKDAKQQVLPTSEPPNNEAPFAGG